MIHLAAGGGESYEAPTIAEFWQPLVGDGAFALTRSMVVFAVVAIVISVVLLSITSKLRVVPGKAQFLVEGTYGMVRNSLARDIIGAEKFKPFLPLLFALFTVILVNNLMGVTPFITFPTFSRIGYAIVLTAIVYFTYHGVWIARLGVIGWLKSFVPPGLPGWIVPFMWVLEFMTYVITRPLTLALRLFGNMFAGHFMLLIFTFGGEYLLFQASGFLPVTGALAYLFTLVMYGFEVVVQFLQAYVFVLLTCVYIAGAVADEH
ncbi:F0F1 ATP synthase subunit A [Kineosporia sp. NBRC 101731]|uniref:F0F1 ATP synthase subunit A n=1 Tax=Kineosporia sp. NBRC 101731 TaxID=3032199 RepID=UPI0024A0EB58|nr:F0F1 ATP synthase subunit A [Kineosporia sp. NBRC 101731]GLY28007.1 ATP synthase subunit a [Kineosporia sp. NBRC 101731]